MKQSESVVLQRLPEPALQRVVTYNTEYERNPSPERLRALALEAASPSGEGELRRLDLANIDAHGLEFYGLDLTGSSFAGSNLKGAQFANCKLDQCNFDGAVLQNAKLFQTSCRNTTFVRSAMGGVKILRCSLEGVDFDDADLQAAAIENSTLNNVSMEGTELYAALIQDCMMSDITISGGRTRLGREHLVIEDINFIGNQCVNVEFSRCVLKGAKFEAGKNGYWYQTSFNRTSLVDSEISGNFNDTRFSYSTTEGGIFRDLNLRDSTFHRTDYVGTRFERVNFKGCEPNGELTFRAVDIVDCQWPPQDDYGEDGFGADFIDCDCPPGAQPPPAEEEEAEEAEPTSAPVSFSASILP